MCTACDDVTSCGAGERTFELFLRADMSIICCVILYSDLVQALVKGIVVVDDVWTAMPMPTSEAYRGVSRRDCPTSATDSLNQSSSWIESHLYQTFLEQPRLIGNSAIRTAGFWHATAVNSRAKYANSRCFSRSAYIFHTQEHDHMCLVVAIGRAASRPLLHRGPAAGGLGSSKLSSPCFADCKQTNN